MEKFEYITPRWLTLSNGAIFIAIGSLFIWVATFVLPALFGFLLGIFVTICGIIQVYQGLYGEPTRILIDAEKIISGETIIEVAQIDKIELHTGDPTYYMFIMKDQPRLYIDAPYLPSAQKKTWAALQSLPINKSEPTATS